MGADTAETFDLRGADQPRLAAYDTVRRHQGEGPLELIFGEEPSLTMQAVALMMRHAVHWAITDSGDGVWRVRVTDREQAEPASVTELLTWEHDRLDKLFGHALRTANEGDLATTASLIEDFDIAQCRHLYAENDVLTPRYGTEDASDGSNPTQDMLDDHERILGELRQIQEMLELGDASMAAPLIAMTSGSLAKHEGREENQLFPRWHARLQQDPEADALLARVQGIIAGAEDDQVPYWSAD